MCILPWSLKNDLEKWALIFGKVLSWAQTYPPHNRQKVSTWSSKSVTAIVGSGYIFFMIFESSTTIDIEKCRRDLKKSLLIFKNTSNIFKKLPKKAEKS